MHLTIGYFNLQLPDSFSLKDKRRVIKSLQARIRNTFNVSVAEIDFQDEWQRALLGIAVIGSSGKVCDAEMQAVYHQVENFPGVILEEFTTEVV